MEHPNFMPLTPKNFGRERIQELNIDRVLDYKEIITITNGTFQRRG